MTIRTPNSSDSATTACALAAGDYAGRVQQWREVLNGTTPHRTATGAVRVVLDADRLPALSSLIAEETRCCPFFTFTLITTDTGVQLGVDAPDDARSLLDELFLGAGTGQCAC